MSVEESLRQVYRWLLTQREAIAVVALLVPMAGTIFARIGKAGRTDADGKFVASVVVGVGLLALVAEMVALALAKAVLGARLAEADLLLVLAPPVCLVGCIVGVRLVFPLNQLASVRTFTDVGAFALACLVVVWLFAKFRGWGIFFAGGIGQMIAIGLLLVALLRRLYRRAFRS